MVDDCLIMIGKVIISYPMMMKITQIEVFKHFPAALPPSRMKGSSIRANNQIKPIQPIHSQEINSHPTLAIIQDKRNNHHQTVPTQLISSVVITPPKNQVKKEQKLAKTISVMVNKQRNYACLSARVATPTMAKQFSLTPHQSDLKDTQASSARIVKTVDRYANFDEENETQCRLSLSHFQAKVKSALKAKAAKTEEELIHLKLEGTNYKITTKCTHSDEKTGKPSDQSQFFEKRPQIYLTQDHSELAKMLKGEICDNPNVNEFKQIMSKMHVENDKPEIQLPSQSKQLKIRHRKQFAHSASVPSRKKTKQTEPIRQHVKVNIINIMEQNQITSKRSSHQIFNKHFKQPQNSHLIQRYSKSAKPTKAEEPFTKAQLFEELKEIRKQINFRKGAPHQPAQFDEKQQRYTTNFIQEKLKKRKSLIDHYTFKKVHTQSKQEAHFMDDFHVAGWEMDQKEGITS